MGSKTFKKVAVPFMALALSAAPAGATAQLPVDYSKNGATGQYAPPVVHKSYAMNGASGDYTPSVNIPKTVAPVAPVTQSNGDGFAWGAAAIGAGSALLVVLMVGMTTRRVRRRRISAPTPARPSAA
jgi:hypothetical protein